MLVVVILGLFVVLFSWLKSSGKSRNGLRISFLLIFIFLALRYQYGNDYVSYLNLFESINFGSKIDFYIGQGGYELESGWILLNYIFKPFGFFSLVIFTSFIYCICYYLFFVNYVPKKYYWLALIIFIFNPSFLLIQLSAMRQSIAIILVILSFKFILKKRFIPYAFLILIAALFHKSVLIFLPVYFLKYLNLSINNKLILIFTIIYVFYVLNISLFIPESGNFLSYIFERYESNFVIEDVSPNSGLGIIYQSIIFFFVLFFMRKQPPENQLMFNISIIYLLLLPIGSLINLSTRINYYFQSSILVVFPLIIKSIKFMPLKFVMTFVIIIYCLYNFIIFFKSPTWIDSYFSYQTIFSSVNWH